MTDIVVKELTKRYPNGFEAVKQLSLEIVDSELLVLVGPSGCGKTTALRMIAGLEDITSGDLYIGGRRMNDVSEKDRDIAMVFQNYALYPHMTVAQNIGFSLKLQRTPRKEIRERVRETARLLAIEQLLDRRPKQLSGGQRQRVAMGRAVIRQPQVFLMDEPLSNLDAQLRVHMRGEIEALQKRLGVTTVYVTHDQVEAMTMGDRVVVMRNGLLQQVDKPQVLYERPRNLFVAEFIGSPAMNLVVAELARTDGDVWVRFGDHRLRLEPATLDARPALVDYEGREVVVGIRPEDMEDAAVLRETHPDRRISVLCDIREDMGSEVYAHFNVAAKPVTTKEVVEALVVENLEDEEARLAAERARGAGVTFVARLERQTRAHERRPLEIEVDVTRLHFFDPETGLGVGERGDGDTPPP